MEKIIQQSDSAASQINQLSFKNLPEQQQREQMQFDKLQSNLQLLISQDAQLEKQEQKDLKNVKEGEKHNIDEQEKLQEEEKVDQKESQGYQQQGNKQNDDQQKYLLFQELINFYQMKVTQQKENQSLQQNMNQTIFNMLQSISTEQQNQLISLIQESNDNNKTFEMFSEFLYKAFNLKENFQKYLQKQNSQNFLLTNFKSIKLTQLEEIYQKSKNDFNSELTIKKGNIKKYDNNKQKRNKQIQNIFEENIIHQIINSVNNIYSFNDKVFQDNNDLSEQFENIEFIANMMFPSFFKLDSEIKRLSIYIDPQKYPTFLFDPVLQICKILTFPINFTEAIMQKDYKLQNQIYLQSKDQYKELYQKMLDMHIKFCDICMEEVEIRETIKETTQEYKKELRKFYELVKQTKTLWVGVKQKQIEIQPIRDQQLQQIKRQLQHSDKKSLNKVNDELKLRNFYLVSYLTKGGEADILKGYQFIQNVIKQDCIFRCMSNKSKSFEQKKQEYDLVRSISSPKNIIQYLDYIHPQDTDQVVFVVEKCQFSLWSEFQLFSSRNMIDEFKLIQIVLDLIEGLIEMRIHKIVHGDIKPGNILKTQKGYYVYSDFGLANIVDNDDVGVENKGFCDLYSPPEQKKNERITYKSDIYSLGKTILKLIDVIGSINCSEQTRNLSCVIKQLADDYMIQGDPKQRYDCFEIFLKFYEKIFNNENKRFLQDYLRKVELLIINNDFALSQNQKSLKNFDYEYYQKILYTYYMLYIRITFFINGINIDQKQLEESIQNNQFQEYNILTSNVAILIEKIGVYFELQNDLKKALQCYKQSFNIYKILGIITQQIFSPLKKITQYYIKKSKLNEGLKYLLEEYKICEVIFQNNNDIIDYFGCYLFDICQAFPQQEKDLQQILEGLETLYQHTNQFSLHYVIILEKIIKIYKMQNDIQNVINYKVDLFETRMQYQPKLSYELIETLICDIIQLHDECKFNYSHFIIYSLKQDMLDSNSETNQKRLYILHTFLGKYYYINNKMECALEQFQKAHNIQENKQVWNQHQQQELIVFIHSCLIILNKKEELQLFLFKYPVLKQVKGIIYLTADN